MLYNSHAAMHECIKGIYQTNQDIQVSAHTDKVQHGVKMCLWCYCKLWDDWSYLNLSNWRHIRGGEVLKYCCNQFKVILRAALLFWRMSCDRACLHLSVWVGVFTPRSCGITGIRHSSERTFVESISEASPQSLTFPSCPLSKTPTTTTTCNPFLHTHTNTHTHTHTHTYKHPMPPRSIFPRSLRQQSTKPITSTRPGCHTHPLTKCH